MAVHGSGPVVYALTHKFAGVSSIAVPIFFFSFFGTCLAEKIGFPCTNKACWKRINAHRLPICISLRAGWVCSTDQPLSLRLYVVPEQYYGSIRQWSSGMHPMLVICWRGCKSLTDFFLHFLSPVLLRKLAFHAQTKFARRR